jgi:predicted Rossmann-fold nucleotide-binding protein
MYPYPSVQTFFCVQNFAVGTSVECTVILPPLFSRMEKVYEKRYIKREEEYKQHREVIAVFSSVSNETPKKFKKTCAELGEELSKHDYKISYGASVNGCNKWLLNGAEKTKKGDIRAVGYSSWAVNKRIAEPPSGMKTELIKTDGPNLMMRIAELKRDAMACVVLPGGPATLEEMWSAIGGVAEFEPRPVIILNIDGFYDSTKAQMNKMADYFYWPKYKRYVIFAKDVEEVIEILNTMRYVKIIQRGEKPYRIDSKRMKLRNTISKRKTRYFRKKQHKKFHTRKHT